MSEIKEKEYDLSTVKGRIDYVIDNDITKLDLSNMGLSELPEIPEFIKWLDISGNLFNKIPEQILKLNLEMLNISDNKIEDMKSIVDIKSLEVVILHENKSSVDIFPSNIKRAYTGSKANIAEYKK